MRLVPRHVFTLTTDAPLLSVSERLKEQVEPIKMMRFYSRKHTPYQGVVSEESFKIHRIIHYRNSFLPVIRGRFEERDKETLIHVTMNLHPLVVVFLGVWVLGWFAFAIPLAIANLFPHGLAFVFLGMPILFLVIAWGAFWVEVNRSQRDLEQIILVHVEIDQD